MFVADAAAIKVSQKPLWKDVTLLCAGSYLIACSIPKTSRTICSPILLWPQHHCLGRWGMEKIQKNISTCFFRCEPVGPNHGISGLTCYISLAQQQASLGWECQNHAGFVQRFVGESGRYLSGPYYGHHITCMLLNWFSCCSVPYPGLCRLHFSLLEPQVWHSSFIFICENHWPISRIWKKYFVERGWQDSSWPYDDLQRCSASHYQWFPFKASGS